MWPTEIKVLKLLYYYNAVEIQSATKCLILTVIMINSLSIAFLFSSAAIACCAFLLCTIFLPFIR